MATIDELMQGKQPGEIKVCQQHPWKGPRWFRPFFKARAQIDNEHCWYGVDQEGASDCHSSLGIAWSIWQEPTRCEDCEKLRKERDAAVSALASITIAVKDWEAER